MADNVITTDRFKKKEEIVMTCDCGCQLWYVLETYRWRCYGCSSIFVGEEDED